MDGPEGAFCNCNSPDSDALTVEDLEKRRSQELLWPSATTSRLVFISLVEGSEKELFLGLRTCNPSGILPVKDILPPLFSVSSQHSLSFHHHVFHVGDIEARMHCPAGNAFPPGLYRWIDGEIWNKGKLCPFLQHQSGVGWNINRPCGIYSLLDDQYSFSCTLLQSLVQL